MSKIVVTKPEGKIEEREIEMGLDSLREILEGHIEAVPPLFVPQFGMQNIMLLVNESGKVDNLTPTIAIVDKNFRVMEVLVGTVICVGMNEERDDFTGLTDAQVKTIKESLIRLENSRVPFMIGTIRESTSEQNSQMTSS